MPSATLVHSFPVPLGRRGTAAAAVIALHVLLGAVLVTGLAVQLPIEIPSTLPPVHAPPQQQAPRPRIEPLGVDPWHFTRQPPELVDDLPTLPPPAGDGPVVETTPDRGAAGDAPAVATAARVLRAEEPPYPAAARRLGEQGTVVLRVRVGVDGRAEQVELAASSGSPRLDDAALRSVRGWLFRPAASGGGPVASWTTVRVVFRLTG